MGVILSDLSRSITASFDWDFQPWDFRFPRVFWPDDWRLPHLRGFESAQRNRDFRNPRIWRTPEQGGRRGLEEREELEWKLRRAQREAAAINDQRRRARGVDGSGGNLLSRNSSVRGLGLEKDLPLDPSRPPSPTAVEDPLDDLARYVRKARMDLKGFSWEAGRRHGKKGVVEAEEEREEARKKRDEAFEVLNLSRSLRVKLTAVKRMKGGAWGEGVRSYLASALPSTPTNVLSTQQAIFALPSSKFATLDWHDPSSPLLADLDRAIAYFQRTVAVTSLSVLCAVRQEEEGEDRARAENMGFYRVASISSPLQSSAARTFVLLDREDSSSRLLLLEVQRPRERVFEEFVTDELDFELTAKDQVFHREHVPHSSVAQANALQAHIFASCIENRVLNFVVTDINSWVFGNVDPASGLMVVSPVLYPSSKNPSIFECFTSLVIRSFDARPASGPYDDDRETLNISIASETQSSRHTRRPSLTPTPTRTAPSSRQPSFYHADSHSPLHQALPTSRHATPATSRPLSTLSTSTTRSERDLHPVPHPSRSTAETTLSRRAQPPPHHPRQYPVHSDEPESYAKRARPPLPASPSSRTPFAHLLSSHRPGPPRPDSSDDDDEYSSRRHYEDNRRRQPVSRARQSRQPQPLEHDEWDDEERAWRGRKQAAPSQSSRPALLARRGSAAEEFLDSSEEEERRAGETRRVERQRSGWGEEGRGRARGGKRVSRGGRTPRDWTWEEGRRGEGGREGKMFRRPSDELD